MPTTEEAFAAYVGIDWGDQTHAVALLPAAGTKEEHGQLQQTPETIDQWATQLRQRFGGRPVAICLEQSKGGLIYALMKYEFLVLYPVNPKQLARFREVFAPSGSKDDPSDAGWALRLLVTHRDQLRPWSSFDELRQAAPDNIAALYRVHGLGAAKIQERLKRIAAAVPLTSDAALIESARLFVRSLARQLAALVEPLCEYDRQLDRLQEARQMQDLCGISPVTRRSGRTVSVLRRWACNKFLRQTFHEFAHHSLAKSAWAKAYYDLQRQRGKKHHAAVRALAFKWIRILFRCWKDRTLYDELAYCGQLMQRRSPLLAHMAASP